MSWKNQSSRTNTGKHTFVNSNYSLSTNLISEESKILGKGLFYNDVDICGNLTVGGTLDVSNIDIELLTIENMEVSGNLLVKGTLGVSGDVDFSNNLFVAGDISCNGELHFADLTYDNLIVENKLDVSGLDISNNLFVAGDISCNGELHFADLTYDNLTVENKLDVSGLDISNNLTIGGTISGDYLFVDDNRIHIGRDAGQINQNVYSVAIGDGAGITDQNEYSVAIGSLAGQKQQNKYTVAIGPLAGNENQNRWGVAIGDNAGYKNQGQRAVAIGYYAGEVDQSANSIILNAQDVSLNCDSSGLFIAPIRTLTANSNSLFYDTGTKEVFYSTEGGGGGTFDNLTVTDEVFYDIETLTVGVLGDISSNSVSGTVKDPTKSNVLLQCLPPSFVENAKILSDNISDGDNFGGSVAMSGTGNDAVAIVGAIFADGSGVNSGAAYLFDISDGAWVQKGNKIVGDDTLGGDYFGASVAITGTLAIVGAYQADGSGNNSGAAYLFDVSDGGWVQIGNKIVGNNTNINDYFGWSVAITGTKNDALAIVGAYNADASGNQSGAAYLFDVSDGGWVQKGNTIVGYDTSGGDRFGASVAISGTKAIVGAILADASGNQSGAAYLFDVSDGGWVQKGNTIVGYDTSGGDQFGTSVAISGTSAIVGARLANPSGVISGAAYLFDVSDGGWVQKGNTIVGYDTSGGDQFGYSVAISGTKAIVGARFADANGGDYSGAAYLFDVSNGGWVQNGNTNLGNDTLGGDQFGWSVAMSGTGNDTVAIVGAPGADLATGAAYIFDYETNTTTYHWDLSGFDNSNQELNIFYDSALNPNVKTQVNFGTNNLSTISGLKSDTLFNENGQSISTRCIGTDGSGRWRTANAAPIEDLTVNGKLDVVGGGSCTFNNLTVTKDVFYDIETITVGVLGDISSNSVPGTFKDPAKSNVLLQCLPPNFVENAKILSDNIANDDQFGYSVAMSGTGDDAVAIVGANFADGSGVNSGAAYLFDISDGAWVQKGDTIVGDNTDGSDWFGQSVAISGTKDNALAIVGAYQADGSGVSSGAAYLFDVSDGGWVQIGNKIVGNNTGTGVSPPAGVDWFGYSVAISGTSDNALAIVGAPLADGSGNQSGAAYLFDVSDGGWVQKGDKIFGDNTDNLDNFGYSVAISGTKAIVGAYRADGSGNQSGAAYLFDVSDGGWVQIGNKIVGDDTVGNDRFGQSVAISGAKAIVGAPLADSGGPNSGAAYLFDVSNGGWVQKGYTILGDDTLANDRFGQSVAISGTKAIVGAYIADGSAGAAYLFDVSDGGWVQKGNTILGNDTLGGDQFGHSVAISGTGNDVVAIVGAYDANASAGAAYIFDYETNTTTYHWDLSGFDNSNQELNIFYDSALNPNVKTQVNFGTNNLSTISGLKSDTLFNENGQSISTRCIGTDGSGRWRTANAAPIEDLTVNGKLDVVGGGSCTFNNLTVTKDVFYDIETLTVGVLGDISSNSVPGTFKDPTKSNVLLQCLPSFGENAKILSNDISGDDQFGYSVAISGTGNDAVAIVGAYQADGSGVDSGAAYLFDITDGAWVQKGNKIVGDDTVGDDYFGYSVAITGTLAIVGAYQADGSGNNSGAAYLFDVSDGGWVQIGNKIVGDNTDGSDYFGWSVAISGTKNDALAIVGAYLADGSGGQSGAAYLFDVSDGGWVQKGNTIVGYDTSGGDYFGVSVAMSGTGNDAVAIVGAIFADGSGNHSGAAYLFDISDGAWAQKGNKIVGDDTVGFDQFGYSVAISGTKDDALAIVGANLADGSGNQSGAAYLFDISDGGWAQIGNTIVGDDTSGGDQFGYSVAISGTSAIVGARLANPSGVISGAAYLFDVSDGGWVQKGNTILGNDTLGGDYFGRSVAITGTGNDAVAIVGANNANASAGAAYIFDYKSDTTTYHWDLSGFDNSNQELNIFYDSALNPNVKTQVNFGTNNLSTISGLKSDTLFNENGQSISTRCIGTDGSGRWRTANAAPIEDLTVNGKLDVVGGGSCTFNNLTVTKDVFYDIETITVGVLGDISSNSVPGTVNNPSKSNVLLQCLPSFGENAKILSNDISGDDQFGYSVAISGTGNDAVAIVGAPFADPSGGQSGAAYLFDISDGAWVQIGNTIVGDDTVGDDYFGWSVAITGTKNDALAIVGAYRADGSGNNSGAAYLFDVSDGGWVQIGNTIVGDDTVGDDVFGWSVAISGTLAIVGAYNADASGNTSGAAYLFDVSDGGWAQIEDTIIGNGTKDNDHFGYSVAISGTLAIVGANNAVGSGNNSGAAYLFDVSDGGWVQNGNTIVGNDTSGGDYFGNSVAISGTKAIVGARFADLCGNTSGAAYLFDVSDGGWAQIGNTILGNDTVATDQFGLSVAMSGTRAIVGARFADANGNDSGAAYLFDVSDGGWVQKGNTIVGNDTVATDEFGWSVAMSGTGDDTVAIVGARYADGNGNDSGAAYIFDYKSDTTTYHWDLSGFDNSNQELNIFYDSALNPGVKTQVNFGTNNLSTISGLKSDTLFNENGQSISTRCIGTDGKGRWRTANAAPAGLAAVVEKFHYYCSGQTHTLKAGGTTSITDVTAPQTLSTSYATITGSSLAYTPPSGASQVNYKFTFAYSGDDPTSVIFIKCFLDGTEITVARNTFRFQGDFTESERIIEVPITINGLTDDIPNATVNTWSSSKTFHIETRDDGSSSDVILHEAGFFRAGDGAGATGYIAPLFIKPMVEITAIKF